MPTRQAREPNGGRMRFDNLTPDRIKTGTRRSHAISRGTHRCLAGRSSGPELGRRWLAERSARGSCGPCPPAAPGIGNVLPIPSTLGIFRCRGSRASAALQRRRYRSVNRLELRGHCRLRFHYHGGHTHAQKDWPDAGLALDRKSHDLHAGHLRRARRPRAEGDLLPRLNWIFTTPPGWGAHSSTSSTPGSGQNGLFWTVVLPSDTVTVDLNAGTATLEVHDLHMKDYITFENSLTDNLGPPIPGSCFLQSRVECNGSCQRIR